MDVDADVALVGDLRLPGVDPHANADRAAPERLAGGGRGRDRVGGSRERDEEGVALGVDLDAVVPGERSSQRGAVLGEEIGVPGAVLLEEPRRAFDVREEEGDGSGRQLGPRHARDHRLHGGGLALAEQRVGLGERGLVAHRGEELARLA